ncbi:DN3 thymocyte differentiation [Desmophyllum pertusum]|uniref:DN3 thymocyte differentiation n=1 Tax=Desmophyllum pertusum TaxID=174260 RepID=A0A9X0CSL9_9CNID|nr:DN3 thymocyte differentiation [Desmophyllum pertusum]
MDSSKETLANEGNSTTMVEEEGMSPMMTTIFYCLYATIFTLAFVGNTFALITCYKTYKVTTSVLLCYIASLASADLMFTLLSIFDLIAFIGNGDWFGGNPVCKIQSFLIESCYTVSILTLVAISYERLKAVSSPVLARAQNRATERTIILKIIWVIGIASCGPLLYAYYVKKDEETSDKSMCVNEYMGDLGRQIYYAIQAGLLFVLPLGFMIWAHARIFQLLSRHVKTRNSIMTDNRDGLKQRKVTKMLAIVTLVFFICYGPFMVVRALRYFYVYNGDIMWRLAQMMIFGQAAVNPIIYCFYSKQFRFSFRDLLRCRFSTAETRKLRSASTRSVSSFKSSQTFALNDREFCAVPANRV